MGDMADYYLERALAFDDYEDSGYFDEDHNGGFAPRQPQCKYCGSTSVVWHTYPSSTCPSYQIWRLYNTNGTKHFCKAYAKAHQKAEIDLNRPLQNDPTRRKAKEYQAKRGAVRLPSTTANGTKRGDVLLTVP